ncbi:hypothetical protein VI817_001041 [Penicillium citrinum]|nr:hypothetical protein VI817_001041 [Penicillium citrinum]
MEAIHLSTEIQVKFLTQGGFNKIYKVHHNEETYIMRVSLPVQPVATLDWVCRMTDTPLPKVLAWDATRNSEIGFEWILMAEVPGKPFQVEFGPAGSRPLLFLVEESARDDRQHLSTWDNTRGFSFKLEAHANRAPKSPTSHPAADTSEPRDNILPNVGRIVSLGFLWGSHARQNVDAGPFHSSQDWMSSRLAFARNDCEKLLAKFRTEEGRGDDRKREIIQIESTQVIISKLEGLVHRLFLRTSQLPEPTMITHDDLNNHSIMVNDNGKLMGVLDWACVSALPLWKACYYPRFLQGPSRFSISDIKMYEEIESESDEEGFGYFSDLCEWETIISTTDIHC